MPSLHGQIVPGQVRGGGIETGRQKRHDGRIIAAIAVDAAQARIPDLGDEIAFSDTGFGFCQNALVHLADDPPGNPHIFEFLGALLGALPVHETGCVQEAVGREMGLKRGVGGGGEPVIVHLDADREMAPSPIGDDRREIVHRMAFAGLHVVIRIADDIVMAQIGGALGTIGVLLAAEPDRLAFRGHENPLMDIEGPAVIARQPSHVGRVGDVEELDARRLHGAPRLGETGGVFLAGEFQIRIAHGGPSKEFSW